MNIILIGFMGVGKSAVGRLLAERLNLSYLDSDELIEETEGRKISEIFAKEGEDYFRGLETEVIKTLIEYDAFVASTGGGIVLREENVKMLKEIGPLILLTARPEIIYERIRSANDRPLLEQGGKLGQIKELLLKRAPIYNKAADYTIDTSDAPVETVVEEIIKYVQSKS